MLKWVSQDAVEHYLRNDWIAQLLDANAIEVENCLTCQRWLTDSPPKRFIFSELYGDLLNSTGARVLDIGGGLTTATRLLAKNHDITVLDLMAHDEEAVIQDCLALSPSLRLMRQDWFKFEVADPVDVVIANDLFPNVDQRLELFIDKFLPLCRELRLSLTYYNSPRFYLTRRLEGDEILCLLAWNGQMTAHALRAFLGELSPNDLAVLSMDSGSPYANGRQVALATLSGDTE